MRTSRARLWLLGLALLVVLPASASGTLQSIGARGALSGPDVPLPPGVRRLADLAYGPAPAQRLDVYVPAHPNGNVILMAHGGGWRTGDKAMPSVVDDKVAHWVTAGTVLISINYRLLPEAGPLQQANDVTDALVWSQRRAHLWGGDPLRFVLMGHSAGAHLVALVAADPAAARGRGALPWRGTIALDSAALDVERLMHGPHLPLYDDAFGRNPVYWRATSPYAQLTGGTAPMLLVCSTLRLESCSNARRFADRARLLDDRARVLPLALSHRDIDATLGLPGAYTDAVDAFIASLPRR